jgi:hypothetical protein
LKTYFLILRLSVFHKAIYTHANMSSAQELNFRFQEAGYLNAVKKGLGLEDKSTQSSYDDHDRDNSNSSSNSDDEIQTRSKTTRKTARRNERNARKQQHTATKQQHYTAPTQQESESASPVEKKQKKLTKRQQVLQRYADEETAAAAGAAASVLASIADAAVTRSQLRNRNTVVWTEKDRAAASRAADIAVEVATQAAEAAQGRKKKEQPTPYCTRLHEKNRSNDRFQKEIGRIFECDFY